MHVEMDSKNVLKMVWCAISLSKEDIKTFGKWLAVVYKVKQQSTLFAAKVKVIPKNWEWQSI